MLCYPQNAIIVEKILFFDYSETTFRGETKTPGSWSFGIQNIRISASKKLKIASKIFLKGRIDEKKKLAYAP